MLYIIYCIYGIYIFYICISLAKMDLTSVGKRKCFITLRVAKYVYKIYIYITYTYSCIYVDVYMYIVYMCLWYL